MGQFTIYLEDELEAKVRTRAQQAGLSVSEWIANAIESSEKDIWPSHVVASFGTWDDFPDLAELRATPGHDFPREKLK